MGETSIAKLQKSWAFSASSLSILQGISHFNVIALAALMAKVAVIDGVLFQRAIGTWIYTPWNSAQDSKNITAYARTTFPTTGVIATIENQTTAAQTDYTYSIAVRKWLDFGEGINNENNIGDCDGVGCVYVLKGVGFAVDCVDSSFNNTFADSARAFGSGNGTIFSVKWDWHLPDESRNYSSLMMNITTPVVPEDPSLCPTTFHFRQCELRPAVVNYTVAYTNFSSIERSKMGSSKQPTTSDKIDESLVKASGSQLSYSCQSPESAWISAYGYFYDDCRSYNHTHRQVLGVNVSEDQNIFERRKVGESSKLAGIFNALRDQFTADAVLHYEHEAWSVAETGWLAPYAAQRAPENSTYCNYGYTDQTNLILQRLNMLMLQMTVKEDPYEEQNFTVSVPSVQFYKDVYYTVDYRYAWAAIGLTILVVLCVLPSYWQFWILGREVTLGPLEIANAFRGPMFVEAQTGSDDVEKIIEAVGHKRLRYQPAARPGEQPGFQTIA